VQVQLVAADVEHPGDDDGLAAFHGLVVRAVTRCPTAAAPHERDDAPAHNDASETKRVKS